MALVETASGMNVQVSGEDFENVSKKRWWVQKDHTKDKYYVYTEERKLCPVLQRVRRHKIYLHRFLTNCPAGWVLLSFGSGTRHTVLLGW